MPLLCPRCGAQNADGTQFCQNCAQPLSGGAAGTPPGAPPPGYPGQYPAPGYPSPYYTMPGGPPPQPAHRLPWMGIIGSVIGALGVLTACAVLFLHPIIGPPTPVLPTPAPSATSAPPPTTAPLATATATDTTTLTALPTATPAPTDTPLPTAPAATNTTVAGNTPAPAATALPTDTPAPAATALPTDTPAPRPTHTPRPTDTPAPTSTPVPKHQPGPGGGAAQHGHRVATNTFALRLPAHWRVLKKDKVDILLANSTTSGTGILYIAAGTVNSPVTVQSLLGGFITNLGKQFPDTKLCGKPAQFTVDRVVGVVVPVCYTYTPQGGSGFPAVSLLWGATNAKGTTIYLFQAQFAASNKIFVNNVAQLLRTLTWTVS